MDTFNLIFYGWGAILLGVTTGQDERGQASIYKVMEGINIYCFKGKQDNFRDSTIYTESIVIWQETIDMAKGLFNYSSGEALHRKTISLWDSTQNRSSKVIFSLRGCSPQDPNCTVLIFRYLYQLLMKCQKIVGDLGSHFDKTFNYRYIFQLWYRCYLSLLNHWIRVGRAYITVGQYF